MKYNGAKSSDLNDRAIGLQITYQYGAGYGLRPGTFS